MTSTIHSQHHTSHLWPLMSYICYLVRNSCYNSGASINFTSNGMPLILEYTVKPSVFVQEFNHKACMPKTDWTDNDKETKIWTLDLQSHLPASSQSTLQPTEHASDHWVIDTGNTYIVRHKYDFNSKKCDTLVAAFRVTPRHTNAWTRSSRAVKDLAVRPPPAVVRVSSALISLQTFFIINNTI